MRAMRFGLHALLVTMATAVLCLSYITASFSFSQAKAIERLSNEGWTFGRIQDDKLTWTQAALLSLFPTEYLPLVKSAKAPTSFSSGTLSSSIEDLRSIEGLETLILNGGVLNASDVRAIGEFAHCTELDLSFCEYDDSLPCLGQSIGQLKQLRILRLSSLGLPGYFLRSIHILNDLQLCEFSGLTLEAADIEHIISFPRMRFIDISGTGFDIETLSDAAKSRITIQKYGILQIHNEIFDKPLASGS